MTRKAAKKTRKKDGNSPLLPGPWTQLIGLDQPLAELTHLHQDGGMPQVLVLEGREGLGKTSLAFAVAALNYCDTGKACGHCHPCLAILAQKHPEIHLADSERGQLTVDDVAAIQEHVDLLPDYSNWTLGAPFRPKVFTRTVIITDLDRFNTAGANRLLKTLEEPWDHIRFIMTTSRPKVLLPTIRSRCVMWHLRPPPFSVSLDWLRQQVKDPSLSDSEMEHALRWAGLAPGRALSLLKGGDDGVLGLTRKLRPLFPSDSLLSTLDIAHEIARMEGVNANHIAEACELVLNQHYRLLADISGSARPATEKNRGQYRAWRLILREGKAVAGRGKIPLAKQLLVEALGLGSQAQL